MYTERERWKERDRNEKREREWERGRRDDRKYVLLECYRLNFKFNNKTTLGFATLGAKFTLIIFKLPPRVTMYSLK